MLNARRTELTNLGGYSGENKREIIDDSGPNEIAGPMDFTGRPMKGFVFVDSEGVKEDEGLKQWIERCVGFAKSLPKK